MQPTMDILKKKRKVVRAAFARLRGTLEEVTSRAHSRKRRFQNSSGFRVVERESIRFKESGRGDSGSVAPSRYAGG